MLRCRALSFSVAPSSAQASSSRHCALRFSVAPSSAQASSAQLHQPSSTSSLRLRALIIFIDAPSRAHPHGCAVAHSSSSALSRVHLHCPFHLHRRALRAIISSSRPLHVHLHHSAVALIFIAAPSRSSSSSRRRDHLHHSAVALIFIVAPSRSSSSSRRRNRLHHCAVALIFIVAPLRAHLHYHACRDRRHHCAVALIFIVAPSRAHLHIAPVARSSSS